MYVSVSFARIKQKKKLLAVVTESVRPIKGCFRWPSSPSDNNLTKIEGCVCHCVTGRIY